MPNRFAHVICSAFAVSLLLMANAMNADAAGFGIFTQGASALGQADAVVAHSDSPEAIFFNPALLTKLPGTQAEISTTLIFPDRKFKSNLTGNTEEGEETFFYPSTLYLSHQVNDKLTAGLGIFSPFGLGTDWADDWEGRYLATESSITTFNINPVLAYQITPAISVAVGVDFVLLDATLEKRVNMTALTGGLLGPIADSTQKFEGDGTGVGYNLGLVIDLSENLTFGVSYRSEVDIDIDGSASAKVASTIPEPTRSTLIAMLNSAAKTDINMPAQAYAGIAYRGIDRLVIEAGVRWEEWSSFKELQLRLDNGLVSTTPKNWHDTWAYNIGGKYQLNETVTLLGGYLYGENAVPADTLEPGVPDSNSHLFCFGSDLTYGQSTVSVSLGYQHQKARVKNNNMVDPVSMLPATGANGKYESDLYLVGLSYSYRF